MKVSQRRDNIAMITSKPYMICLLCVLCLLSILPPARPDYDCDECECECPKPKSKTKYVVVEIPKYIPVKRTKYVPITVKEGYSEGGGYDR